MINDNNITLSTGSSRRAVYWYPQEMLWSAFVAKLATPIVTPETFSRYKHLSKSQQDDLKDVGGFVAGRLKDNRRKRDKVLDRCLITLDADNIPPGGTEAVLRTAESLGCAYVIYSTRKHETAAPRLRIVIPLDTPCTAEQYEPIARKVASYFDLSIFDPTTFETHRLMYWPSISADMRSQYVYTYADKGFLSKDGVLGLYHNQHDVNEWPEIPGAAKAREQQAKRQGDPTAKTGVVGAFCRIYDIPAAMDTFLPGVYTPTNTEGRYTYAGGSTVGGAVLYDNGLFLYSHHATDPISGLLCNAFDLVRIHKFGDQDADVKDGTPTASYPSYQAMRQLAVADEQVKVLLIKERQNAAQDDSAGVPSNGPGMNDDNWQAKLQLHPKSGAPLSTIDNALIILEHDPNLAGRFYHDDFANRALVCALLPWEIPQDEPYRERAWSDADDAGLRHYMEHAYQITGQQKILDSMALCAKRHARNKLKEYLDGLVWDGVCRVNTLLIDYFGAPDTAYTQEAIRRALAAAVARVYNPGTKFDNMLILSGAQGIGKSTFFSRLGGAWFSDSLRTFEGKEASELLQGYWIVEVGELEGFNKSEMGTIKQFLSKQDDIYRAPYGRRTEVYPRRCVFFGTTNESDFLRDRTGNRRFWPVDVSKDKATKDIFNDLTADTVNQIWAEAKTIYRAGEPLYLTGKAAEEAEKAQEAHGIDDPREGIIADFIARPVTKDWLASDLDTRRLWWSQGCQKANPEDTVPRDRICAAEIWCELFLRDLAQIQRRDSIDINRILYGLSNCERTKGPIICGQPYGDKQRAFWVKTTGNKD